MENRCNPATAVVGSSSLGKRESRNLSKAALDGQLTTLSLRQCQQGLEDDFLFYNGLRPHQALGYRTPAEVFHGEQEAVEELSNRSRYSPEKGT